MVSNEMLASFLCDACHWSDCRNDPEVLPILLSTRQQFGYCKNTLLVIVIADMLVLVVMQQGLGWPWQ